MQVEAAKICNAERWPGYTQAQIGTSAMQTQLEVLPLHVYRCHTVNSPCRLLHSLSYQLHDRSLADGARQCHVDHSLPSLDEDMKPSSTVLQSDAWLLHC